MDTPHPIDSSHIIPSHAMGVWLLKLVHKFLDLIGLDHSKEIEQIFYVILVVLVSLAIGWSIKKIIVWIVRKFVSMRHSEAGNELLQMHVFDKCAHFIPPLIFAGMIPLAFSPGYKLLSIVERLVAAYTFVAIGIGLSAVGKFIFYRYNKKQNTRNLPIKGILNISLGIIWIVITIVAISVIVDKSPAYLLTGLGAFAAALMLIFKDSILGFVAGIQMSQNDMLHTGDWIVVPGTPANGIVLDVTLTAVKVQNFDNTIVTVPPYTLVSTSFQNYRGMKLSGARRFTRTFTIDISSVAPLDAATTARVVAAHPEMKPFIDDLRSKGSLIQANPGIRPVNGTVETNLGLFRAYCAQYLLSSPWINSSMQVLVRILDPVTSGIPLDFYAFAITTDWNEFEAIQSAVMEHFATAMADFGLAIYNAGAYDISLIQPAPYPAAPATTAVAPAPGTSK